MAPDALLMTVARQSLIGTLFADDYRVESLVAEGGMGAVFSVVQQTTGRKRALKILRPELAADADTRERFIREARVSSSIESDHVVEVIDAGFDPSSGAPFLVMEMLDGQDLARYVASKGPLTVSEAREVLRQLSHALAAAHAAGVIHRDLKPENVFVAKSRRADVPFTIKLLDFGIASVLETSATSHATGAIVGSPAWMAPEQVDTGLIRASTDVWALGLIAFFVLTAKNYWKSANSPGSTVQALLVEKLIDALDAPSARATLLGASVSLPAGFDGWFARCVCRDPSERFPDAARAWAAFDASLSTTDLGTVATQAQSQPPWSVASGAHSYVAREPSHAGVSRTVVASPTGPSPAASPSARRSPARTALSVGAVVLLVAGASSAAWVVAARTTQARHADVRSASVASPTLDESPRRARESVVAAPVSSATPVAVAPANEERPRAVAPARVARTVSRAQRSSPRSAPVDSPVSSVANAPSAVPAAPSVASGPRPSRCAAYTVVERRANALIDHASSVEATDPTTARNERIQAMTMRASVDAQVAQLRAMARGELSGDPEFVAMSREVDQCIANLRRGHSGG